MKVVIVGGGYVGVTTAAVLAEKGHRVFLVERDAVRLEALKRAEVPFYEPGLCKAFRAGRIECRKEIPEGIDAQCAMVCVGTPQGENGAADLSQLWDAEKQLLRLPRSCVIAVRSTVPPGTCDLLAKRLCGRGCRCAVAFVPEFLAQGAALQGARCPDRVVFGLYARQGEAVLRELYAGERIFVMSRVEAELTKLCANAMLAVRLAFAGELAQCCECMGADYCRVADAVGQDPRIGRQYLDAGAGFGGSCLPKDGASLLCEAAKCGVPLAVLRAALEANERQKQLLFERLHRYYRSVSGLKIAVLGLSFKPQTDDLRNSPAEQCVRALLEEGAEVAVWDEVSSSAFLKKYPSVFAADNPKEALLGAHACLIFTAWEKVRALTAQDFLQKMRIPLVLDGRRCLNSTDFSDCGVVYEAIGRGNPFNLINFECERLVNCDFDVEN